MEQNSRTVVTVCSHSAVMRCTVPLPPCSCQRLKFGDTNRDHLELRVAELETRLWYFCLLFLGQEVLRTTVPLGTSEQRLATNKLAAGLYTLRVVVGQDVVSRKVVLD